MKSQLKQATTEVFEVAETHRTRGVEIVTPEVEQQCVLDCMFAPELKQSTVAWFNGFFDEMNLKPHRYDFCTPKGIPEYYHLGYQFAYVYSQQLDALSVMQEADYVQ
tara:strand:- start:105 stop:425 length:321 start_codon:yes stop_codon:yes gene_type:complete